MGWVDRQKGVRQKGFSLIELMVAIIIGIMAVYATYRIYMNVESNYRSTETANEAQVTGLYASLTLSKELSNAGAGIMNNGQSYTPPGSTSEIAYLKNCANITTYPTVAGIPTDPTISQPLPLYPLPVAVIPVTGAHPPISTNPLPDDVYVFYGTESITDLPIAASNANGGALTLTVPAGLLGASWAGSAGGNGLAQGSVLIWAPTGGNCSALSVQNAVSAGGNGGAVVVTVGAGQNTAGVGPFVIDVGKVVRRRFFVDTADLGGATNPANLGTLKMETWQVNPNAGNNNWTVGSISPAGAAVGSISSVPIAANVVAFNVQYGVATAANSPVNRWITPDINTVSQIISGAAGINGIIFPENIKAIRFGLIVSTAEPDTSLGDPALKDSSAPPNSLPAFYTETFFADCPTGATCDPPQTITLQTWQPNQPYGWRYRKYETTVPLQNVIWNP